MSTLDDALTDELALRSRLNALVHEQAEAHREMTRLRVRGEQPGADPELAATAARWKEVAARVATDIEEARAALRRQEAVVAALRADEAS